MIYNYQPTFTGLQRSSFEQCYMFQGNYSPDADDADPDNNASSTIVSTLTSCMLPLLTTTITLLFLPPVPLF